MKNKILIGIVAFLALLLVSVRFMFKNKFEEFKVSVQQYENEQLANFQQEKEKRLLNFQMKAWHNFSTNILKKVNL